MFVIEGKVAVVTGGASGIGFATVKQLLENGARGVILADVDAQAGKIASEELAGKYGKTKVVFVQTDVSNKTSFEDAFRRAISEFKNLDILVNNAGICDEKQYERQIAVNLTGTIHGTFLALENYILNYRTGAEGVIINTSSIAGFVDLPAAPIYAATKSAVINLTRSMGSKVHYENTKIKVATIAPGFTASNIFSSTILRNKFYEDIRDDGMVHVNLQPAEFVAKEMMKIIKEKPSGTIWICEDSQEIREHIPSAPIKEDS